LVLPQELLDDLEEYVIDQSPIEACGFLSGSFDGAEAKAKRFVCVKNISESTDRFVLDPNECDRVFEDVRGDEELVGFVHSHPSGTQPSGLDRINMRFLPLVWLIFGGVGAEVSDQRGCSAFKIDRRETRPVEVRVVERARS
jgi:proteasome lid subunit RPN8/RPN11